MLLSAPRQSGSNKNRPNTKSQNKTQQTLNIKQLRVQDLTWSPGLRQQGGGTMLNIYREPSELRKKCEKSVLGKNKS